MNLWYHVGSRNEQRGRTGFAHLFEHFFFNGSEHYPHGFREAMDDLGANNRNGTTSTDRTNFFEDVPLSGLERTLYLEADRMGYLAANITEAMLERERGVVQERKAPGREPALRPRRPAHGRGACIRTRIRTAGRPSAAWPTWTRPSSTTSRPGTRPTTAPTTPCCRWPATSPSERARELVSKYFGAIPPGPPVARLAAGCRTWTPTSATPCRTACRRRASTAPGTCRRRPSRELACDGTVRRRAVRQRERAARQAPGVRNAAGDVGRQPSSTAQELTSTLVRAGRRQARRRCRRRRARNGGGDRAPARARARRRRNCSAPRTREFAEFARNLERLGGFGGRSDVLAESMTYHGRCRRLHDAPARDSRPPRRPACATPRAPGWRSRTTR